MTTQVHALIKESPELAQDLQDMCDDDANFARQAAEFAVLAERLAAVQAGNESLSAEDRLLLEQQCTAGHFIAQTDPSSWRLLRWLRRLK